MTMWGGRFEEGMSDVTRSFTVDTSDMRLAEVDILGSIAHVTMLGETGIIATEEANTLIAGLTQIQNEGLASVEHDEDVHSAVERRLIEIVGEVGAKLHTGRSRNDQVATDLRLYLIMAGSQQVSALEVWIETLADLAADNADVVIPTYTHLQQAQVTSLGNHLLAYAWMAVRDANRFGDATRRLSESPLGSNASAGSSLPLDRERTSEILGFERPMPNTLDAVGSRDFVSEYVFCCAQTMTHLSRIAEELILWASSEFGWLTLGDSVSTGSSALPHKRNPDIAELVRGRSASVIGDATAVLTMQKGLPLAYNRDLQEDKRIVFHAHDTVLASLDAMGELIASVVFHPPSPQPETGALILAEMLVSRGVAFREAHEIVGRLVKSFDADGRSLADLTGEELVSHDGRFQMGDLPVEPVLPDIRDQIGLLREQLVR